MSLISKLMEFIKKSKHFVKGKIVHSSVMLILQLIIFGLLTERLKIEILVVMAADILLNELQSLYLVKLHFISYLLCV